MWYRSTDTLKLFSKSKSYPHIVLPCTCKRLSSHIKYSLAIQVIYVQTSKTALQGREYSVVSRTSYWSVFLWMLSFDYYKPMNYNEAAVWGCYIPMLLQRIHFHFPAWILSSQWPVLHVRKDCCLGTHAKRKRFVAFCKPRGITRLWTSDFCTNVQTSRLMAHGKLQVLLWQVLVSKKKPELFCAVAQKWRVQENTW